MCKKTTVSIISFALVIFSMGLAFGQPTDEEGTVANKGTRFLGKNLAVNLTVEPAKDKEGFTIITATEHFMVKTEVEKSEGRVELEFEGRITLRGSELVVGERSLGGGKPILVDYRVRMRGGPTAQKQGFSFVLEGSAVMEENEQVVIARSKDLILKLRIGSAE